MSTTIIIGLVALLLAVLIAVAIMLQTIEKNNKEKRRIEAALKNRARNFQHMLESFPEGFLNKDLRLLVCKCLSEVYKQLKNLDPKNATYAKNLAAVDQQVAAVKNQADNNNVVRLSDPAQIKEVQKLLQSLHGFIGKLNKSKKLPNDQAKAYAQQVRNLIIRTSLDVLISGVNDATNRNKPRLAIHYLHMIIDKLNKENNSGQYSDQIAAYKQQITELEQKALAHDEHMQEVAEEWENATEDDSTWKKNAIYD
ncbi:hypothetical protein NO559_16100 [Dasania sp. GY-MA-18]|uniref:DNA repair protein n=1 Tax=Dasania phycosphaerae TaxID=2950436 RepID=A0A9J6RRP3_9GAMM|nr:MULTISPECIES: hypothetical protein [Dasania]MCR8924300.1 hypothetical protein [Dasania sp. GY-MA-18]MCZ0866953.1 hypothetical protein [Dasania phycosphaerae]MCZ0870457.1 hypothetical protein [Dasania phycosphaerae]